MGRKRAAGPDSRASKHHTKEDRTVKPAQVEEDAMAEAPTEDDEPRIEDIVEEEIIEEEGDTTAAAPPRVFRVGVDQPAEDEEMVHDPSAYDMFHEFTLPWSCLSFDHIKDPSGQPPKLVGPLKLYIVAGTQTDESRQSENGIYFMKLSNVTRTHEADDSESDSEMSDSDDEDELTSGPKLIHSVIDAPASINRLRSCPKVPFLVAAMDTLGVVRVAKGDTALQQLDEPHIFHNPAQGFVYSNDSCHSQDGFGLDWRRTDASFFTGARDGQVVFHQMAPAGWQAASAFGINPSSHIEGISAHATDENVVATAHTDGCIYIWDLRDTSKPQTKFQEAHTGDVNVVNFCPGAETSQLLSGGDDGVIKVWDLNYGAVPMSRFTYHKQPICCAEWQPMDTSTIACGSYDDRVTVWDLSAESLGPEDIIDGIPAQLMFEHCGQQNLSEAKWHPEIPFALVSTANSGFNVFRPENLLH